MKLIILDEPIVMREPPSHENKKIMQEMMDILRVLLYPDLEEDVRIGQGVGHVKEHRSDGSHFQEENSKTQVSTII